MLRDRRGFAHIAIILVVVVVLGGAGWYFAKKIRPASQVASEPELREKPATNSDSLGEEVYLEAQSSIGNDLPDTVSTVGNPMNELYKNPFD